MKTYMRYIAVVFAVAMLLCAFTSVSAAYPDVDSKNPHIAAIETMTNLGILGGYEDGTFKPDGLVRRDEMAKIIFVASTASNDAGEGVTVFPDVPKNSWAKGYISWCAGKKIVGGYEDGTFKPEGNITYDEALKMVCAMLGYTNFTADMWPVDVRTTGLIELKLGDKLDGIAGDTALTRSQVVQLVYNSLDKPFYQETKDFDPSNIFANLGQTETPKTSLKDDVWGFTEIEAQIVATENYGLVNYETNVIGVKTDNENEITVAIIAEDGTVEYETFELDKVGLSAYKGKTDELIALNINLIKIDGKEGYSSATLKGVLKKGISGAYAPTAELPDSKIVYDSTTKRAKYGINIGGVDHFDDNFKKIRRLTYFDDVVLVTNAFVDKEGTVVDHFVVAYSSAVNYNRWNENLAHITGSSYAKHIDAIDADSDGYYDYVTVEFEELFKVKSVTSKTITFEPFYATKWVPVPAYTIPGTDPAETLTIDLTFPLANVEGNNGLKAGDIIQGYQLGDYFTITKQPTEKIGYITKYALNQDNSHNSSITLNDGSMLSQAYSNGVLWGSTNFNNTQVKGVLDAMKPRIGINPTTGTYNYVKFLVLNDKVVYAEAVDANAAVETGDGHAKAILLYATEKTEPQLNEATKQNEVFYPAYIVINGRTILVNLDAEDAIDGFSGDIVSREGSEFRPQYVVENDGTRRIHYVNKLVTYTINSNGYYSLKTTSATLEEDGKVIEAVLPYAADNKISINKDTGVVSVKNARGDVLITLADGTTIKPKLFLGDDTILYYEYDLEKTGSHKYLDYLIGNEIPRDFEDVPVTSDIFVKYDEEKGVYLLSTLMIGDKDKLDSGTAGTSDYKTDARQHLYAVGHSSAVTEAGKTYNSYVFKNIYTFEDVKTVNKLAKYDVNNETTLNTIYGWDAANKKYVAVAGQSSFTANDVVTDILTDLSIVYTNNYTDGVKVDETVKIIAVMDTETAELKEITFEDLCSLYDTVKSYNELNDFDISFVDKTLELDIGTYLDENNDTKLAYIIVDWVEYDEDSDSLIYADFGVEE